MNCNSVYEGDDEEFDNGFEVKCPECGQSDKIDVSANVWVRLLPDGTSQDDADDHDTEWDGSSAAVCRSCDYEGTVAEFCGEEPSADEAEKPQEKTPSLREDSIPPDPENQNNERAQWATAAVETFACQTGLTIHGDGMNTAISDLIADIAHLCDRHNLILTDLIDRARMNYDEETDNQGQQFTGLSRTQPTVSLS